MDVFLIVFSMNSTNDSLALDALVNELGSIVYTQGTDFSSSAYDGLKAVGSHSALIKIEESEQVERFCTWRTTRYPRFVEQVLPHWGNTNKGRMGA